MGIFLCFFCFCDLDFDTITFTYEFDPYSLEIYTGCANMNFPHKGFRKLSTDRQRDKRIDRQTRPKLYTMPLYGWSKNCNNIAILSVWVLRRAVTVIADCANVCRCSVVHQSIICAIDRCKQTCKSVFTLAPMYDVHTPCPEKRCHFIFACNSAKF